MCILVVNGAVRKGQELATLLNAEQLQVESARDLPTAIRATASREFDAVVLDLRQGNLDRKAAIAQLRMTRSPAPILVVDGSLNVQDRLELLEAGADDCLSEPVSQRELGVRVRVLLRRTGAHKTQVGDLQVNHLNRRVSRQGKPIALTSKEFSVLESLVRRAGQTVTRSEILSEVWGRNSDGRTNIVDVYINYLRSKIDRDFEPKLIRTVYASGYILSNPQQKAA